MGQLEAELVEQLELVDGVPGERYLQDISMKLLRGVGLQAQVFDHLIGVLESLHPSFASFSDLSTPAR